MSLFKCTLLLMVDQFCIGFWLLLVVCFCFCFLKFILDKLLILIVNVKPLSFAEDLILSTLRGISILTNLKTIKQS